jgi:hypothetical protein
MARNRNRDRNNDWDWDYYYYEYRTPRNDYYARDYDRDYYGRFARDYDRYNYGPSNYGYDYDWLYPSGWAYNDYNNNYSNRGQYYGTGPSNYTRSDDRIQEDVNDRLTWDGRIDASDVNVDVNDGVVTLTGSVDRRWDKRIAEDDADDVMGVVDVNNQLRVRNRGTSRTSRAGGMGERVRTGMEVVGSRGAHIGSVKQVRDNDFLVDRPAAFDVYVPFDQCRIEGDQVHLFVKADQVDDQGWMMPEKMSATEKKNRR